MEYYIGGQGYFGTDEVIVEEIINEKFIKGTFSGDAEIFCRQRISIGIN